jgi:alpha-L-fucosidase
VKPVQYLGVNQREDSVSYARSATETSARIKGYSVYVSSDGVSWGAPVRTGTLPDARGVAVIGLPATRARHIRLTVTSTYAASTDTADYKRLRIDEAWIGSAWATTATGTPQTLDVPLGAGANTLRVASTTANGAPHLNHLDVG